MFYVKDPNHMDTNRTAAPHSNPLCYERAIYQSLAFTNYASPPRPTLAEFPPGASYCSKQ